MQLKCVFLYVYFFLQFYYIYTKLFENPTHKRYFSLSLNVILFKSRSLRNTKYCVCKNSNLYNGEERERERKRKR